MKLWFKIIYCRFFNKKRYKQLLWLSKNKFKDQGDKSIDLGDYNPDELVQYVIKPKKEQRYAWWEGA